MCVKKHNLSIYLMHACRPNAEYDGFFFFLHCHMSGYSPHLGYGMMVQSDYPPNSYAAYGPAAYQCSNPYASSVGPTGYPTPVSTGTAPPCYSMPPPQHIPQLDKSSSKDR